MTVVVDTLLHLSSFLCHSEEGEARRGNPLSCDSSVLHRTALRDTDCHGLLRKPHNDGGVDTLLLLSSFLCHSEEGEARRGNPLSCGICVLQRYCLKEYGLSRLAAQASQ